MPIKHRTTGWLLLVLWMVAGPAFAERLGRLVGKVVDPDGKPIQGVVVTATSPQIPSFKSVQTTDKKGVFTVDFRQIDVTYRYRFDKAGYQSLEAEQEWSLEGTQRYQWTMQPGQSAVVGDVAPVSTSEPAILAYNAGVAAFKAKDNATAEAKFRESVGHDPNLRQAWGALAVVQVDLGHNEEAAAAAEKAVALGSTDEAVLTARWQAYRNLNDEVKAAEALQELERIGRRAEEAKRIHNEAVALVKAKDYQGAFTKFQQAIEVDPTLIVSQNGLAEAGVKIGKNAEAAAAAEAVLKMDPKNEQAIRVRYNACLGLGDKAKLVEALQGLAVVEPNIARNGLLKMAFDAYDANDLPVAKDLFVKALAIDPNYPQAYYYLGVIDVGQGATAEAKSHLERFLQLAPKDPESDSAREMLKYLGKP